MTDYGDLLVLTLQGRILMISRDMDEIAAKMTEHYEAYRNKAEETIKKANIATTDLNVEERPPYKQIHTNNSVKKAANESLGKLFEL